jgi:hypothetical protein
MAYHKAILNPGQVLRVGRDESLGLAVPHDLTMSEAHFEISWDGSRSWLKDLGSRMGTRLGGERVTQGEVFNGSWVRAGHTDFLVYFEQATPPHEPVAPLPTESETVNKASVLELLRAQELTLYAILDAARSERIVELLRESVEEYRSLYEGPQGEALAEVAPYLVRLPRDSRLLESLVLEGWGHDWGIYLTCPLSLLEVRRHFRKLLMVDAEGQDGRLYFRFYDPRVLGSFLNIIHAQQRSMLFGSVKSFLMEGEEDAVLSFTQQVESEASPRGGLLVEKQQILLSDTALMAAFLSKVSHRILQEFKDEPLIRGMAPDSLRQFIQECIDDARSHGVVHGLDVEYFVICCVLLGPNFHQQEKYNWAAEVLGENDWDGTTKMRCIAQRLMLAPRREEA